MRHSPLALLALTALASPLFAAEQQHYEVPRGYRDFDLADPKTTLGKMLESVPEGSQFLIPAPEEGIQRRLLLPRKAPGERFAQMLVESRPDDGVSTATAALKARLERAFGNCKGASVSVVAEREENYYRAAFALSHCPHDEQLQRGRVVVSKLLLGGERLHVADVEFHYPPFEVGKTPLLKSQLDASAEWLATFKVCADKRGKDCRLYAGRLVEAKPRPISAEEQSAVARIEQLGALLFHHDRLAWNGTDEILERNIDLGPAGARGWLTETRADGANRLVFFGEEGEAGFGIMQVDFADQKPVAVTDLQRARLEPPLSLAHRALRTVRATRAGACSEKINTAVFKDPTADEWLVYWLSSSTDLHMIVHGGHTRFRVDGEGTKIIDSLAFTKTCMFMPYSKDSQAASAEHGAIVSQLTTPMPTEIHVFNSLVHGVPIIVLAPDGTWRVKAGKLERLY
jgi:hypothetical protein